MASDTERLDLAIKEKEALLATLPSWPRLDQMKEKWELEEWFKGYTRLWEVHEQIQGMLRERGLAKRREQYYLMTVLTHEAVRLAAGRQSLIGPFLAVILRRCGVRLDLNIE